MRKNINDLVIEGRLYEHKLEIKTVKNQQSKNYGKPFIQGTISIAVDEDGLQVIPVEYTYVSEVYSSGKPNSNYAVLTKIINEGKTWLADGKEEATLVKCTSVKLLLNEYYGRDGKLVSSMRNKDGFVSIVKSLNPKEDERHKFTADVLFQNAFRLEPDENESEERMLLKGYVFDFTNAINPVEFVLRNPQGIDYFEGKDISASNPFYVKVWGKINNSVTIEKIEEETGFGGVIVNEKKRPKREYLIENCSKADYEFGETEVLTADEFKTLMQDRETKLATLKANSENRTTENGVIPAAPSVPTGAMPQF